MPDYPGLDFGGGVFRPPSARNTSAAVIGFVDKYGRTRTSRVGGIDNTTTDGEVNTLRNAMGAVSNAGVYFDVFERKYQVNKTDAEFFEGNHSSVSDLAYLVFVRNDNDTEFREVVEIPAIDEGYVLPGGSIDSTHADIQAVVTAAEAVLNKRFGVDDAKYRFSYGKVSDRKGDISPSNGPKPSSAGARP
jgi:hypothetical protein